MASDFLGYESHEKVCISTSHDYGKAALIRYSTKVNKSQVIGKLAGVPRRSTTMSNGVLFLQSCLCAGQPSMWQPSEQK